MKKFFLCCIALLAVVTANAQGTLNVGKVQDTDNLSSIPYNGYMGVCSSVSADVIKKYAGSQVVGLRFALGSEAVTNLRAFISADPDPNAPQNDLASATASSLTADWNEVTFAQPYTLTGNEKELYIGYFFSCSSTEERPVLVGTTTSNYGLLVYEDGSYGTGWYDYSATGDLAIQLILRGGNLPDYDIALEGLAVDARYYATTTEKMRMAVSLVNKGTKTIPGLTLSLTFDNNAELGGSLQIDEEISGTMQLPLELPLNSFGLTAGRHTLTLRATEVKGGISFNEGSTEDDATSTTFYIYENSVPRTHSLLEVYASSDEYFDSHFTAPIEAFLKEHSEVVPIFIYGLDGQQASSEATQLANAAGVKSLPSFGFNRTTVPGASEYLYEYTLEPTADDFADLYEYLNGTFPAFAGINLEGKFDTNTRLLTLSAKGSRNADFRNIFSYGSLTIYLTEDDVDGRDHVLRKVVTAALGNVITWNLNGGLDFSRDYRLTADSSWDINKMHAVAFIHKMTSTATRHDNMDVTNTTVLDLSTLLPTAVRDLATQPATTNDTTFDLSGRRVETPVKRGLYIKGGKKYLVK